jgi:hypothetical protein
LGVTDSAPLTSISFYRHRDTAISLARLTFPDDKYLHDDFAFATRESLIPDIKRRDGQAEIEFDFVLTVADAKAGDGVVHRQRVEAAE